MTVIMMFSIHMYPSYDVAILCAKATKPSTVGRPTTARSECGCARIGRCSSVGLSAISRKISSVVGSCVPSNVRRVIKRRALISSILLVVIIHECSVTSSSYWSGSVRYSRINTRPNPLMPSCACLHLLHAGLMYNVNECRFLISVAVVVAADEEEEAAAAADDITRRDKNMK